MDGKILASNYKNVDAQIKELNKKLRELREKRTKIGNKLYDYAEKRGYSDSYCGVPMKKLIPKNYSGRRTVKQKQADGVEYLKKCGVPNADEVYNRIKRAEMGALDEESSE